MDSIKRNQIIEEEQKLRGVNLHQISPCIDKNKFMQNQLKIDQSRENSKDSSCLQNKL